jgi:hypothetical protein|nr:MAG: hypothetical protein [Bacteriophage sp.]
MKRKIVYPRKRVVVLEFKNRKSSYVYNTCPELVVEQGKRIGVTLNALWNALAKNNGAYENERCKIYYRKISHAKNKEWV